MQTTEKAAAVWYPSIFIQTGPITFKNTIKQTHTAILWASLTQLQADFRGEEKELLGASNLIQYKTYTDLKNAALNALSMVYYITEIHRAKLKYFINNLLSVRKTG